MLQEIIDFICEYRELDPATINGDSNLVVDCSLGSFDIVELCCQLEDKFDVTISEDDIVEYKTIKDLADSIESKKN